MVDRTCMTSSSTCIFPVFITRFIYQLNGKYVFYIFYDKCQHGTIFTVITVILLLAGSFYLIIVPGVQIKCHHSLKSLYSKIPRKRTSQNIFFPNCSTIRDFNEICCEHSHISPMDIVK